MLCQGNFYPRPPRGGRPTQAQRLGNADDFYPRPPRGGRPSASLTESLRFLFLSTPSARRATCNFCQQLKWWKISIHALREEGDGRCTGYCLRQQHFYPRPPRGGRHPGHISLHQHRGFLSTPSARRATFCRGHGASSCGISIHALREEGDSPPATWPASSGDFYPRPPRGGRPKISHNPTFSSVISIHALREEGDGTCETRPIRTSYFYPRPPRGGRPGKKQKQQKSR